MTTPRPPMSQAASEEALRAVTIGELVLEVLAQGLFVDADVAGDDRQRVAVGP